MTEKEPFEHDDVVSSLLDLQRRLRDADGDGAGGEPNEHFAPTIVAARSVPDRTSEIVEVTTHDLSVLMTPVHEPEAPDPVMRERFAPVTQLPTASSGEDRVTALSERLSRLEQELSGVLGSIDSMRGRVAAEVTTRLTGELATQRRDLAGLLERRIGDMEASLRDAIYEMAGEPEDVTAAD